MGFTNGGITTSEINHKQTIDTNPDFEKEGAFQPDIPNGTRVQLDEVPGILYEWNDGELAIFVEKDVIQSIDSQAKMRRNTLSANSPPAEETTTGLKHSEDIIPPAEVATRNQSGSNGIFWVIAFSAAVCIGLGGTLFYLKKRPSLS